MVGSRPEQASQTVVFSFGAHNWKCALPVRLEKSLNTNKFAICEVQSHFVRKRVMRRQDPHVRQVENSCVAELEHLLEPGRQDWDSFIYI